MASPPTAREADKSESADAHPQVLLAQEFATLSRFIPSLLANL